LRNNAKGKTVYPSKLPPSIPFRSNDPDYRLGDTVAQGTVVQTAQLPDQDQSEAVASDATTGTATPRFRIPHFFPRERPLFAYSSNVPIQQRRA